MHFTKFSAIGTTRDQQQVEITCDGETLHFVGRLGAPLQEQQKGSIRFAFPVLGITQFSVVSNGGKGRSKKPTYRAVEILITLWDGAARTTGVIEFSEGQEVESYLLRLQLEIEVSNIKWPLSRAREMVVRGLHIPGRLEHMELLGPQGQVAFQSCLDRAPRDLVHCWSASGLAHSWPLGFEETNESGNPLYVVLMTDRIALVRPESDPVVREILGSDFASIDLVIGNGETKGFGCVSITTCYGTSEHFWLPIESLDRLRRLYRFTLLMWSLHRPFDVDDFTESLSSLEKEHADGSMDTVTYATLVSGIAKRVSGELPPVTYPAEEETYIHVPETVASKASKGGTSASIPIGRAIGVGLVAGAAKSLLSD